MFTAGIGGGKTFAVKQKIKKLKKDCTKLQLLIKELEKDIVQLNLSQKQSEKRKSENSGYEPEITEKKPGN